DIIINLAGLKSFASGKPGIRPKKAATTVIGDAVIYILLEDVIDFAKEKERLEKELAKLKNEISGLIKKLNNEDFLKKAPDDVVEKVKDKHNLALAKQQKIISNLEKIKSIEEE
ncbi:MAG: valine--tRNA ligase, partial [Desulfobacterium sp.]|nr:valine--tRNA ligase [Desulfobacterium sp.]MBU4035365.1 valine--tRNA ligase [Pseudomonadota bacterium]